MNFISVSKELPSFDQKVIVRTSSNHIFTARLMADEEGDYWMYDLPSSAGAEYSEVQEPVISWAYIDGE